MSQNLGDLFKQGKQRGQPGVPFLSCCCLESLGTGEQRYMEGKVRKKKGSKYKHTYILAGKHNLLHKTGVFSGQSPLGLKQKFKEFPGGCARRTGRCAKDKDCCWSFEVVGRIKCPGFQCSPSRFAASLAGRSAWFAKRIVFSSYEVKISLCVWKLHANVV